VLLDAGEPDVLDAHLSFQLNAGVGLVLAPAKGASPAAAEVLDEYEREGFVRRVSQLQAETPAAVVGLAAEHGADWVLAATASEFWWPRSESLQAVLEPVPPRYTIVQALVRELAAQPGAEGSAAERSTVRPVLGAPGAPPAALRHVRRLGPGLTGDDDGRVPLRAWYPIEVFLLPGAGLDLADDRVASGLADGSLVSEERLRNALHRLASSAPSGRRRYALPAEAPAGAGLSVPSVVDDAAYAVECAAAGEVDLAVLDEQIRELEGRITELESGLWPRVIRRLSRSATRGRV
jgi:hypothetical protein